MRSAAERSASDALTGVLNRRYLTDRLAAEVASGRREGTKTAALSADVDDPKRLSILVVDDDEGMRAAIDAILSPRYRVALAVDGVDGLAKGRGRPTLDLIITDVAMPNLDGISMVRRFRECETLRNVPVIFLTGRMSLAGLGEGLSEGTFVYLPKPTDLDVLQSNVESALR